MSFSRLRVYNVISGVWLLLLIGVSPAGFAQLAQPLQLPPPEIITARQGLPQAFVPAIVQDRQGFIWMATRDGLCRYDGYGFKVFQPAATGQPALSSSGLSTLTKGPDGNLWITTDQRDIDRIDPVSERFLNLSHQPFYRRAVGHDTLEGIYPDHRQRLWLMLRVGGLLCFDLRTRQYRRFTHQPADPHSLGSNQVNAVIEDGRNGIWVATADGLDRFDEQTGRFRHFRHQPGRPASIPENAIDHLYQRPNGDLWLQSRNYLTRWNPATEQAQAFGVRTKYNYQPCHVTTDSRGNDYILGEDQLLVYSDAAGLRALGPPGSARRYVSLFVDGSDVLWVGTDLAGVYKFNLRAAAFTSQPYRRSFYDDLLTDYLNVPASALPAWPSGTSPYNFRAATDAENRLWFSVGGTPIYRLDKAGGRPVPVPFPLSLRDIKFERPTLLAADPDGQIWVVHPDWSGHYQATTGRWVRFTHPLLPAIQSSMLQAVLDRQALWIATSARGLYRVDRVTGQVRHFSHQPRDTTSLSSNNLYWLTADPLDTNQLWIGTFGSGLCRFDKRTGRSQRITTRQGLPNNVIYAAIPDRRGSVWVATNQGLGQLDRRTGQVRIYTQEDGLSADEFNRFHALMLPGPAASRRAGSADGRIVLGGVVGLTGFDPGRIRADTFQPRVQLSEVLVNNRPWPVASASGTDPAVSQLTRLRLPYNQNFVTVRFAAMQYNRLGRTQYRYQLTGLNGGWVVTSRPEAIYTALPPGEYQLRIQAANTAGQWSRYSRELTLLITPPWWATGWAYTGYALLGAALLWTLARYRTRRERDRQERLNQQREADQLRTVDELKTRFFANITHEFRTPLTLILSPVGTLLTDLAGSPYGGRLSLIERNARQLLGLINQLMELARLDAHLMGVTPKRGRPNEVIDSLVQTFTEAARASHIHLHYAAETSALFWFDADKLARIAGNLIANALKFTPGSAEQPGRVTVTLRAEAGVQLVVADTGIGLSADQLPHIFDRFFQADAQSDGVAQATGQQQPGTGIGLALVKELVDLQRGQIRVESQPGRGTTFWVDLPYQPVTDHQPGTSATPAPENPPAGLPITEPADTEPAMVLLVEDNDDMARFISQSLPAHYQVHRAADGLDGLEQARQLMPDLIISDVMMPRMDGYQLCQHLKTDPGTDHIPVILLTAKVSLDSRMQGLTLGADAYLDKPFHVPELQLRVRNLLATQRRLGEKLRADLQSPVVAFPAETGHPFLTTLYGILDRHLDDATFGPEELATQASLSRMQLYRKLKAVAGLPATDFIRGYRLKQSVALLQQGMPVAQTAYAVGFENPSYFGQCFREQFGESPSRFTSKPA